MPNPAAPDGAKSPCVKLPRHSHSHTPSRPDPPYKCDRPAAGAPVATAAPLRPAPAFRRKTDRPVGTAGGRSPAIPTPRAPDPSFPWPPALPYGWCSGTHFLSLPAPPPRSSPASKADESTPGWPAPGGCHLTGSPPQSPISPAQSWACANTGAADLARMHYIKNTAAAAAAACRPPLYHLGTAHGSGSLPPCAAPPPHCNPGG